MKNSSETAIDICMCAESSKKKNTFWTDVESSLTSFKGKEELTAAEKYEALSKEYWVFGWTDILRLVSRPSQVTTFGSA